MDLAGAIVCLTALVELAVVSVAHYGGRRVEATKGRQPSNPRVRWVREHAVPFSAGGLAVFVIGVAIVLFDGADDQPSGLIVSPANGEAVERDIVVRGTLADIPSDQHVWVLVRDGNLLYPHQPEVTPREGEWTLRVNHGGKTKLISLELYRMNEEDHRFTIGRAGAGGFSDSDVPGSERLDVAENLRVED